MFDRSVQRVVDSFTASADWFVALTRAVPSAAWEANGLGEWTVLDLVGHTSRALSTVWEYLTDSVGEPELQEVIDYYRGFALVKGSAGVALNAGIAERGRQAGTELGGDPAATVMKLRDEVVEIVNTVSLDRLVTSRGGSIRMREYLPTRTLELIVHGLDLHRALTAAGAVDLPPVPSSSLADVAHVLVDVAAAHGPDSLAELATAVTGRTALRADYSVL